MILEEKHGYQLQVRKAEKIIRMGKSNEKKKAVAGKHSCVVNGPESGDSDIVDSDDSMKQVKETEE